VTSYKNKMLIILKVVHSYRETLFFLNCLMSDNHLIGCHLSIFRSLGMWSRCYLVLKSEMLVICRIIISWNHFRHITFQVLSSLLMTRQRAAASFKGRTSALTLDIFYLLTRHQSMAKLWQARVKGVASFCVNEV